MRCCRSWLGVSVGALAIACDDAPQTSWLTPPSDRCPAPTQSSRTLAAPTLAGQSIATIPTDPNLFPPAPPPSPFEECLQVLAQGGASIFTPEEAATRLATALWASNADTLLAALGELPSLPHDRIAYADQAAIDPHARAGYRAWAQHWLGIAAAPPNDATDAGVETDAAVPDAGTAEIDPAVQVTLALQEGLLRFVETVMISGGSLATLLNHDGLFVDATTAPFYGVDWSILQADEPWLELELGPRYGGLLTQGWMLRTRTLPATRGSFVLEKLLGTPPPILIDHPVLEIPEPLPGATHRASWQAVLNEGGQQCTSCHAVVDNPGFPFSHYDELGQYQETDQGNSIDSSAQVVINQAQVMVQDADDYAQLLAKDPKASSTVAQSMFDHVEVTQSLAAAPEQLRTCHEALDLWIDLVWLYPSAQPPALRDLFVQITTRNWLSQPFGPYSPAPTTPSPTPTPSNPNPALPGTTGTNPPPSMAPCP
jgi:hypothetical protein